MKKLLLFLLALPIVLCLILAILIGVGLQQGLMSRSDLAFLYDLGKREGINAVVYVVRAELYGVDTSNASDPSFGREQIAGRGHAPWVIRGNLDDRPRMIKFALEPGLWAAYEIETQSLYQVWEGEVRFEGAAYNYQHGPQPSSSGSWFTRNTEGTRWAIKHEGQEYPAMLRYLGHEYSAGQQTASMRFTLTGNDIQLELTETPEVSNESGERRFLRQFARHDTYTDAEAVFYTPGAQGQTASGTLAIPLTQSTSIEVSTTSGHGGVEDDDVLARGEDIIASSDCLGCHGEQHKIAGPAWSQISGKFRGRIQQQVIDALADSVLEGAQGTWGPVPMPPHPEMSLEDARAAVTYILSIGEPAEMLDGPVADNGQPYSSTYRYDVLPRLTAAHPSFDIENLAPEGFQPKVGGMAFRDDGTLLLASWDTDGAVFSVDPSADASVRVTRIAEGLQEPLGLTVVGDRVFVLQKQEITELIDRDHDGIVDQYRAHSYDWKSNSNFHSFAFGLLHRDDALYFLLSICVLPGGASCPEQEQSQGKLLRASLDDGGVELVASGFRTPNGINLGPDGAIYVTDNQGDWLPASKLVRINEGAFYGSRAVPEKGAIALKETPPIVWLPQDEVGNSPTEPLALTEGPYAGQMIHGDVYNGGIKRVFIEEVNGQLQGAAFHFSAGFGAPVNRLARAADGSIYVGEAGSRPNWGEYGKPWYGLERMRYTGNNAFEMRAVRLTPTGFTIELTQPLAEGVTPSPKDLVAQQWFYHPNEQYGGPKYDVTDLTVSGISISADRTQLHADIQGLKAGYVAYLRLDNRFRSEAGHALWTAEAWYTINALPEPTVSAVAKDTVTHCESDWETLFNGESLDGWRNYGGDTARIEKWTVDNGTLALQQQGRFPWWDMIKSAIFGGPSGDLIYYREKFRDFELSLEWKISENGNSGIFYLVADEEEKMPWETGIEMQVLDNDGHIDGKIVTHRAGDLYDLVAADPETVLPPGQWNQATIRIKDNLIEHWLNGERVLQIERGGKRWNKLLADSKFIEMPRFGAAAEGYIVLQDHGDRVWYRNIKVRRL